MVTTFDVRTPSVNAKASSLSGGNLQKFLIGRELLGNPKVLSFQTPLGCGCESSVVYSPDAAEAGRSGASIILISQDIDELLSVTDRICVICHGRLSRTFSTEEMTPEL